MWHVVSVSRRLPCVVDQDALVVVVDDRWSPWPTMTRHIIRQLKMNSVTITSMRVIRLWLRLGLQGKAMSLIIDRDEVMSFLFLKASSNRRWLALSPAELR